MVGAGGMGGGGPAMMGEAGAPPVGDGTMKLMSPVVMNGERLPPMFRCVMSMGMTGPSPAFNWTAGPAGTMSYALTLTDTSNGYAHWTIYDIPVKIWFLQEGVPMGSVLESPFGAKQAQNENAFVGGPGYFGPCAQLSVYEFKLYALDVATLTAADDSAKTVRAAIEMHDLTSVTLSIMSAEGDK
jgi:phosphatidylethanolamine-binding protein (PEBP) family uncharacterized protein